MENLPPLYLDLSNCRQGMGGRQESFNFPPDFGIEEIQPLDDQPDFTDLATPRGTGFLRDLEEEEDEASLYFTPRESESSSANVQHEVNKRKCQSLKVTLLFHMLKYQCFMYYQSNIKT